jgi:ribosome biogenesis GTPase
VSLRDYGWDDSFSEAFDKLDDPGLEPARVVLASGSSFRLIGSSGERRGTLAGRLLHDAESAAAIPAVGDWVAVRAAGDDGARIERVLGRRAQLSRKVAGRRTREQVVAANVDVVFVVMGLDGDFSVRRLERLLALVWESGARPVVLLNKLDLCGDPAARRAEVEGAAMGAPVLMLSCLDNDGVGAVTTHLKPRETAVLVGSSGVGKSTLINRLLGEAVQKTREVREGDDRGRHTTSHRELFRLPGGALLIDNPGIREVQLWSGEDSLRRTFEDVAGLAAECRFRDCLHESETGCAVLSAVEAGALPAARLESYRALQKELRYLELRQSESAQRVEKRKWRAIHKEIRRSGKHRGR